MKSKLTLSIHEKINFCMGSNQGNFFAYFVRIMKFFKMRNVIFLIFLGGVSISPLHVGELWGQTSEHKPMLADGYSDYFEKNVNDLAYKNVKNVNNFHLSPAIQLIKGGKPERAIPDLKFVLRWVPNHPLGLSLMATVGQMIQRPKLGIGFFEQAIYLFPQYGLTYAQYGKFLYDLKQNEKAREFLNRAITIDSKLAVAYGWLSLVYYSDGDKELAKETENKAKSLGYKGPFPKG